MGHGLLTMSFTISKLRKNSHIIFVILTYTTDKRVINLIKLSAAITTKMSTKLIPRARIKTYAFQSTKKCIKKTTSRTKRNVEYALRIITRLGAGKHSNNTSLTKFYVKTNFQFGTLIIS